MFLMQILFMSGVTLTIGPKRTVKFFVKPQNHVGSTCFLGGLMLVFVGWPVVGIIAECYGFLALFRSFFPAVIAFLKRLPILGSVLTIPVIKDFITMIGGGRKSLPVWDLRWHEHTRARFSYETSHMLNLAQLALSVSINSRGFKSSVVQVFIYVNNFGIVLEGIL